MYQPDQRPAMNTILCRILSILTAIVIILGVIILIVYFVFKPRYPEIRVDSAELTSLNFTGNYLTAKWDIKFIVSNPNKKLDITYNLISSGVFYGKDKNQFGNIATTKLQPFYQPKKSKTLFPVHFETYNMYVGNVVANGIIDGRLRGSLKFGVVFNAIIKRTGWFHPKDSLLKVSCNPMNFVPSTNTAVWVLQRPLKCD
ncbi:NDR1/HIN1-like protein 6 [Trifolium pratense]|uniref:NDR1/HIN1-like protein 6 n=1 Tax=Trifolium pratense TaxID=57577 RepID=UPI001E695E6A|nr:NDR1/HIN1-like protein 6 [Trifolium pratense]